MEPTSAAVVSPAQNAWAASRNVMWIVAIGVVILAVALIAIGRRQDQAPPTWQQAPPASGSAAEGQNTLPATGGVHQQATDRTVGQAGQLYQPLQTTAQGQQVPAAETPSQSGQNAAREGSGPSLGGPGVPAETTTNHHSHTGNHVHEPRPVARLSGTITTPDLRATNEHGRSSIH